MGSNPIQPSVESESKNVRSHDPNSSNTLIGLIVYMVRISVFHTDFIDLYE